MSNSDKPTTDVAFHPPEDRGPYCPLPTQEVHRRPGATNREDTKTLALPYVDAHAVVDGLDSPETSSEQEEHAEETPEEASAPAFWRLDN
jgi:hypothetical protein